ncbi:MAG: hypothetical protein Q9207_006201 [Kuettlingeria erythrocarpa]
MNCILTSSLGAQDLSVEAQPLNTDTNFATQGSSDLSTWEILPLSRGVSSATRTENLPCHLLRPHLPNPEFYGRDGILNLLRETLGPSDRTQAGSSSELKSFALCGVGGIGKTQIAVAYAYSCLDGFDAIFLVHASDSVKLAQGYTEISMSLGFESYDTLGDQLISKDLVLGWMEDPQRFLRPSTLPHAQQDQQNPKWLLILDNADDLSILNDYWPIASKNGSILITSRDPLAKTRSYIPIGDGVDLEPLAVGDAGVLLRQLKGFNEPGDMNLSEIIASRLSGLPLAITQIARTITRRRYSLVELLELHEDQSLRRDLFRGEQDKNAQNLFTVWAFQDLSEHSLYLINLISFMDPDRITESVFLNGIK